MIKETSCIKLLIKYYNYANDDKSENNELNPTASNSNTALNQNYRYSINSILSNNNKIPAKKSIINKEKIRNSIKSNKIIMNNQKEFEQDYLIYFHNNSNYNNLENFFPPKIINIKTCIYLYLLEKKNIYITLDSLMLFRFHQNQYHLLNDDDNFYPKNISINKNLRNKDVNENNISNCTILYYYICNDKIKVIVDLYSEFIDKISINVSKMCSLLMLKYIILLKVREIEKNKNVSNLDKISKDAFNNSQSSKIKLITIEDIEKKEKIYGNGLIKYDLTGYFVKNQTNRDFNNNAKILEVYNYYINIYDKSVELERDLNLVKYEDNLSSKEEGILNFILMEKKENKLHLGLDFRFTILRDFQPLSKTEINAEEKMEVINYYQNDYFQIKSGLNLYFNCLNSNCKYNKNIFVLNIGYGTFDIFNLIRHNYLCLSCNKKTNNYNNIKNKEPINIKNNIELKYIGMLNAKWTYKGYLEGIKMTMTEGKGFTVVNDILYRTKEFNFIGQFKKLLFQVEFYISKNNYIKSIDSSIISDTMNNENIKNKEALKNNKNEERDDKTNKNYIKKNSVKIKEIEIIKHNKDEQKNNDKFIKFKTESNNNNKNEDFSSENNYFHKIKSKQNIYQKHNSNSIKHTYPGNNKRNSNNFENFDNNNTNIDFNIIIDKAKTNCCEHCLEYDQISRVCSIF